MSRFTEFCESLQAGKSRAEEEQIRREDEEHSLPETVGRIVRRMCSCFGCPPERVRYIDVDSKLATGTLTGGAPLLRYNPESGRHCLDVEIALDHAENPYPIWLHLECVPLQHGGIEFHFGTDHFQVPGEEEAFFDEVAAAINRALREGYVPAPLRIGAG